MCGATRTIPMKKHFEDKLISLAVEAHMDGEESLATVLSTVAGCYRHDGIKDFQVVAQLYLGHGAIHALRKMLEVTDDPLYRA